MAKIYQIYAMILALTTLLVLCRVNQSFVMPGLGSRSAEELMNSRDSEATNDEEDDTQYAKKWIHDTMSHRRQKQRQAADNRPASTPRGQILSGEYDTLLLFIAYSTLVRCQYD